MIIVLSVGVWFVVDYDKHIEICNSTQWEIAMNCRSIIFMIVT